MMSTLKWSDMTFREYLESCEKSLSDLNRQTCEARRRWNDAHTMASGFACAGLMDMKLPDDFGQRLLALEVMDGRRKREEVSDEILAMVEIMEQDAKKFIK